jgi:hypothetical protein
MIAVSAISFSSEQLSSILNDCFEDYLVPVSLPVTAFVQRFGSEGLNCSTPASGLTARRQRPRHRGPAWR